MAKLYGGLKSPKQSSLRAVGTVPAATGGGGGDVSWWQARINSLTPDPHWDDVALLMQVHPDDAGQGHASITSFTPDRKYPAIEYTNKRTNPAGHVYQSSDRTAGSFMDFVAAEEDRNLPLGCGHLHNQFGCLEAAGSFDGTDYDPRQDWTAEIVMCANPLGNANNHDQTYASPWNFYGASNGYKWGWYSTNPGTGMMDSPYFYTNGGAQTFGAPAVSDPNGDRSAAWMVGGIRPRNMTVFYDHSATSICLAVDGILCPTYGTAVNFSSYDQSACSGLYFSTRTDSVNSLVGSNPSYAWTTAFRFTWGDRYGLSGNMATRGYPAQFTPDLIFPEQGA
jgi:hypothetical protein|tara:strand:- start:14 stop:1024 length:1011 start_codon:yes stop_codon:yes gene_type:complete